jgi:hypothetical protein
MELDEESDEEIEVWINLFLRNSQENQPISVCWSVVS